MGLLKDYETNSGIEIKNAYFRIGGVAGSKELIEYTLEVYISRDLFEQGKRYVDLVPFSIAPDLSDDSENIYRQGYAYLKQTDGYKYADDVLEEGQIQVV